ncbi:hypothetical protein ACLJK8_20865 [Amaricoccus sp. W119]
MARLDVLPIGIALQLRRMHEKGGGAQRAIKDQLMIEPGDERDVARREPFIVRRGAGQYVDARLAGPG